MSGRVCLLTCALLLCVCLSTGGVIPSERAARVKNFKSLWPDKDKKVVHLEKSEVFEQINALRSKRQAGAPVIHGDTPFSDANRFATIHYSGSNSPVIIVLTYTLNSGFNVSTSNLYRSVNYGKSFEQIDQNLDSSVTGGPTLWYDFHVGNSNKNLVVFMHASEPKLFFSLNEGQSWSTQTFSVSTIDPRTLVWNSERDNWALAHDIQNGVLYLTQNLGRNWDQLSINVDLPTDYQWGNPKYYDATSVFYNTFDPTDFDRGDFTVGLYKQTFPYSNAREVDPNLGSHDAFLMVGPYTFVQKRENNVVYLYTSYKGKPFNKAMIPNEDPHQTYFVAHIDELQALVIVEHVSGQNNLFLSDEKGVYFSLSLPDLVVERNGIDLEVINGVNGTLIANQYVRAGPGDPADTKRTLITLDNGGEWALVLAPDRYKDGTTVDCDPPQCSLHFHMSSTEYYRTGVYSVDNAPGLVIAHGTIGSELSTNPDLFLSRDGGVTWEQTLTGSWGITVADHGGLMVAAQDYHQYTSNPSRELQYTCNEGQTWTGFTFTTEQMVVFGVITEPGEYTTTVSLYGVKPNSAPLVWDVVTVNFSTIFERSCISNDFYDWMPWDERTDTDCILGADVQIERRRPNACCLIGSGYVRTVTVDTCECTDEDYDCDYGFKHSNEFDGPCIRDPEVQLDDPCLTSNVLSYNKSSGYRKIPGDICVNGVEATFKPHLTLCCESSPSPPPPVTVTVSTGAAALGVLFALALLAILGLIGAVVFLAYKNSTMKRRYLRLATADDMGDRDDITYRPPTAYDSAALLQSGNTDNEDDDEPLKL